MNDEHDDVFTHELATSLRAKAASAPRTTDPYGPVGAAITRSRRRRTGLGASLAVVAVLGGAVAISGQVGRGHPAAGQSAAAALGATSPATTPADTRTPATAPSTNPATPATSPATTPAGGKTTGNPAPPPGTSTAESNMIGWPTDFDLFKGSGAARTAAAPTVDAIVNAYGKPVDAGTRNVLADLVGSFKLCGYQLDSYTFTLRWAGDLPHSGGHGAAIVDVTHGGATYRMAGTDSYKGVWLQLPTTLDPNETSRVEAAPLAELDQPAQAFYAVVVAAPGSKVTVSGTKMLETASGTAPFKTAPVTVGASGVVEVKLTGRERDGFVAFPTITGVTVVRPDGTTGDVPVIGGTSAAQEQAARQLLPANTVCPGPTSSTPTP